VGKYNSSKTRVEPIFNELLIMRSTADWLPELWWMAISTRTGGPEPHFDVGPPLNSKIYERALPPSTAFLKWMVQNTEKLTPPRGSHFGATPGGVASAKRARLFGSDLHLREASRAEALNEIDAKGGQGSAREWWAFEGFTHVDACFETEEYLLLIEGKRTEAVSPSTRWFKSRNQLWRNVEVAGELANGRPFGVVVGVETDADGRRALADAATTRDRSYPHLTQKQRAALDRHLLGFVVWSEVVDRFGLPRDVLRETTDPVP
jgi:hypothetical protein